MSDACGGHGCCPTPPATQGPRCRRVLWVALFINAAMFGIELAGGLRAGAVSLLADAVDFLGDAANDGVIGSLALAANVAVAVMLYAWREGDANMRPFWPCSRSDAIGNLAVMAAALCVFGAGSTWPDLTVVIVMAALALTAARAVVTQAWLELQPVPVRA